MEHKRPTQVIDLPSKGYFYKSDNPLSSGRIELFYPSARDEDILTSKNLLRKGIVIDQFISGLIVEPNIKLNTMLLGDKNALIYASRILAYGSEYNVKVTCPNCGEKQTVSINLNTIEHKEIDFSGFEQEVNEFDFTLPFSKIPIKYKFLTHKDEKNINDHLKGQKKLAKRTGKEHEITTRLKELVIEIDGDTTQKAINEYIDNDMLSKDSLALRKHLVKYTPDLDTTFLFTCDNCINEEEMDIPLDVSFFWPSGKL